MFCLRSSRKKREKRSRVPVRIRKRNNIVKCEGLRPVRSRQIRVEIDLITSTSCRDAVFTSVRESASREIVRASERRDFEFTRVRIGRSIIMHESRRYGREDAWFHLPIANRNRNPVQNRNDRYILRRSGRIEPAAYSSPARFKIVPMHPILFRPLGVAQSAFPTANSAR